MTTSARERALTRAQLPDDLRAVALTPQDPSYPDHAPTFFRGGAPAVILQARDAEHVRSAVLLAAKHPDLPFSVRSGGHGVSGRSTNHGGIVLDLAAMNDIALPDPGTGLVRVEPGAQWLDVARSLEPHGLGISSGDYGGVGVGGLATAGGAGWLVREHGLTIDRRPSRRDGARRRLVGARRRNHPARPVLGSPRGRVQLRGGDRVRDRRVAGLGRGVRAVHAGGRRRRPVARRLGGRAGGRAPQGHQLGDPRAHPPRPTGHGAGQHRRAQRASPTRSASCWRRSPPSGSWPSSPPRWCPTRT